MVYEDTKHVLEGTASLTLRGLFTHFLQHLYLYTRETASYLLYIDPFHGPSENIPASLNKLTLSHSNWSLVTGCLLLKIFIQFWYFLKNVWMKVVEKFTRIRFLDQQLIQRYPGLVRVKWSQIHISHSESFLSSINIIIYILQDIHSKVKNYREKECSTSSAFLHTPSLK